jgi:hypothetical protein
MSLRNWSNPCLHRFFLFSLWRNVLAGRTRKSGVPPFAHRLFRYRSSKIWIMIPRSVVYDNLNLSLYSNGLQDRRLGLNSRQGPWIFLYSTASRPALGLKQLPDRLWGWNLLYTTGKVVSFPEAIFTGFTFHMTVILTFTITRTSSLLTYVDCTRSTHMTVRLLNEYRFRSLLIRRERAPDPHDVLWKQLRWNRWNVASVASVPVRWSHVQEVVVKLKQMIVGDIVLQDWFSTEKK